MVFDFLACCQPGADDTDSIILKDEVRNMKDEVFLATVHFEISGD